MTSLSVADAFDVRAHGREQPAQVDDLGLARGIFEDAGAAGEDCRHDGIFRRADRDDREAERAAGQAAIGHTRGHIAAGHFELHAKGFEGLEVQGRSAVADGAAAGSETVASPARASSGPSTRIEARILRTMS